MEIKKKKVSEAQKRAQERYDAKTKTIAIKYTPANMDEYERLIQYLSETKQSRNKFIKGLIREFLYTTNNKKNTSAFSNLRAKTEESKEYYPFANFKMITIRLFKLVNKYNNDFDCYEVFNNKLEIEIKNLIKEKSILFEDWLEEKKTQVHNELKNKNDKVEKELYYTRMADEIRLYVDRM